MVLSFLQITDGFDADLCMIFLSSVTGPSLEGYLELPHYECRIRVIKFPQLHGICTRTDEVHLAGSRHPRASDIHTAALCPRYYCLAALENTAETFCQCRSPFLVEDSTQRPASACHLSTIRPISSILGCGATVGKNIQTGRKGITLQTSSIRAVLYLFTSPIRP